MKEKASEILENQLRGGCVIPAGSKRDCFTIIIGDNIDRIEHTLDGYGTTHRINNLIIEEGGDSNYGRIFNLPKRKRGRRSFQAIALDAKYLYVSGNRRGPGILVHPDNTKREFLFADREKDNFLWAFLRQQHSIPRHIFPSCTEFNILIEGDVLILKSLIRYMDCIDSPATDTSTIYQLLIRALSLIESLRLQSILCVFDQAIYSKACETKWKEPEKFKNCVLMMGIFHLLMVIMGILYKRFSDAGLRDTVVQSSIVAGGSVGTAL